MLCPLCLRCYIFKLSHFSLCPFSTYAFYHITCLLPIVFTLNRLESILTGHIGTYTIIFESPFATFSTNARLTSPRLMSVMWKYKRWVSACNLLLLWQKLKETRRVQLCIVAYLEVKREAKAWPFYLLQEERFF